MVSEGSPVLGRQHLATNPTIQIIGYLMEHGFSDGDVFRDICLKHRYARPHPTTSGRRPTPVDDLATFHIDSTDIK